MTYISNQKLFSIASSAISKYQSFLSATRYGHNSGPFRARDKDHYGFIPNSPDLVIRALIGAMELMKKDKQLSQKYAHYKFLDAGCGAGNIMLLAHCVGFDVWGIERDDDTIKIARDLLHYTNLFKQGRGIIKADLADYKKYGEYNVIYYYQPMHSNKMAIFVNALCKQMKVGAIILAFGSGRQILDDKRFRQYKSGYVNIYRKTKA